MLYGGELYIVSNTVSDDAPYDLQEVGFALLNENAIELLNVTTTTDITIHGDTIRESGGGAISYSNLNTAILSAGKKALGLCFRVSKRLHKRSGLNTGFSRVPITNASIKIDENNISQDCSTDDWLVINSDDFNQNGALNSYRFLKLDNTVTAKDIGLENVDNLSEATIKSDFTGSIAEDNTGFVTGGDVYAHTSNTANPHQVTKTQVGLSDVDNVKQVPMSYLNPNGNEGYSRVAALDSNGKILFSQLPDSILGKMAFGGALNVLSSASASSYDLTSSGYVQLSDNAIELLGITSTYSNIAINNGYAYSSSGKLAKYSDVVTKIKDNKKAIGLYFIVSNRTYSPYPNGTNLSTEQLYNVTFTDDGVTKATYASTND